MAELLEGERVRTDGSWPTRRQPAADPDDVHIPALVAGPLLVAHALLRTAG